MTTLHAVLYSIALVSQAIVISIVLPRWLVTGAGEDRAEQPGSVGSDRRFVGYLSVNRSTALLGFGPMVLGWASGFEDSLTPVLLTTGVFFFVQIGALVSNRDIRNRLNGGVPSRQRSLRALVLCAVSVYVAYVLFSFVYQNEPGTSTWAKVQVITLANAFFVVILLPGFMNLRRASAGEEAELGREFARSVDVLATISIGLSIYFFGKDVLADLDVSTLRPFVMSVFLQALVLYVVPARLSRRAAGRRQGATT